MSQSARASTAPHGYRSESMRNSHRGGAFYPVPQGGIVRAGGSLYRTYQSPIAGYKEEEMIREAQLRQEYNKKRRQFKQMLSTASGGSATVMTKDLPLAARIAKMNVPEQMLERNIFNAQRSARDGSPRQIAWKPFYAAMEYPSLRGAGAFDASELPTLRRNQVKVVERKAVVVDEGPKEEEVSSGRSRASTRRSRSSFFPLPLTPFAPRPASPPSPFLQRQLPPSLAPDHPSSGIARRSTTRRWSSTLR